MSLLGGRTLNLLMACPCGADPRLQGQSARPSLGSASSLNPLGLGGWLAAWPDAELHGTGSLGQAWRPVQEGPVAS